MSAAAEPAVVVRELGADVGGTSILRDVSFELAAGEIVALFGPSGAGKSTIAAAVADLDRPGIRWRGEVLVEGRAEGRAARVGYLPQHAPTTLNPARRVGRALDELVSLHGSGQAAAGSRTRGPRALGPRARARRAAHVLEVLRMAGFDLPDHELAGLLRRFPFEFSGGQRTRLALAQVLAARPAVLVLDEPTDGLDPLARERLCSQLDRLRRRGLAILLVTHDRAAVDRLADRIVRVRDGRVRDGGVRRSVPAAPGSAEPALDVPVTPASAPASAPVVARLRAVSVRAGGATLVRDIDLDFRAGETIGMLGVSGAGKSTIARCLAGLAAPASGTVQVRGNRLPVLRRRTREQLAAVQYVWQESATSFEPRRRVLDQTAASAIRLRGLAPDAARREALEWLGRLGIDQGQAARYPIGLSGGQLRRAAVARALLAHPSVLLCDEITTGLELPLARAVLAALRAYQERGAAALLVIGHDVRTLFEIADRIAVVDDGRIVRLGTPAELRAAAPAERWHRLLA